MKQYKSLKEIRADKKHALNRVEKGYGQLKFDIRDSFMPSNGMFLNSSNKYMNYIGYAITAYKTAKSMKVLMNFFSRFF
ncbi:MAG: hypothetical protein KBT33_07125 [Prevotellaceae bacterium]|nr:hypothetical protein [Candidatus Minthosoma equi]